MVILLVLSEIIIKNKEGTKILIKYDFKFVVNGRFM